MTVLTGRAFSLVGRRWWMYAALCAAAIAVVAILNALQPKIGVWLAQVLVLPVLTTIVYAFTLDDARGGTGNPWARVLERLWAVIVIDFLTTILSWLGQTFAIAGDVLDVLTGAAMMFFYALLILADASAVVDDEHDWLLLIPRSFGHSFSLSWRRENLWRVLVLFAIQTVIATFVFAIQGVLDAHKVPFADFWAAVPLLTLTTPPMAALIALVYMDANDMFAALSCDR